MDTHEHFVRPEEPEVASSQPWWAVAYHPIAHIMFEKRRPSARGYHGNFQGATVNDPRYTPGPFNRESVDFDNPEADRINSNDED